LAVRRRRVPTVLDTNILVAAFLSRNPKSANVSVYQMWGERRLQLIPSDEIETEYLAVLAEIGASRAHRRALAVRLATRATVTRVRPPRPVDLSRDPLDNMFVAAAVTGRAQFPVTNDKDLLQIPAARLRPFRFRIVTPGGFLEAVSGRRA
jgi:uncharacterized protein